LQHAVVQVAGDANPLFADRQPARAIVHLALVRRRADFTRHDLDERQHLERRAIEAAERTPGPTAAPF
jgi:hypothetical protein